MIRLYDTQSHAKRDFHPVEEGKIRMYVCGPTVYNYIHIGNARTFISFDVIRRYLMWRGFDVTFVQNVTDVDDKIIKKANEEGRSAAEVAAEYTEAFIADMHAAGVLDPDIRPRATEEIDAMIDLVGRLVDAGHAYEVEGDVYFGVRSFPAYGALSNRNVDDLEGGHRELRADGQGLEGRKRDELDFAVWKAAKPGEPSWDSPWGKGRPGWHIECSAMSRTYLGLPLDIHGGGSDLVFPHHENEIAQSEAAYGETFCNYWMHGGMLQINQEKMSKSLGNFLLLRDVLKTTDARVLRMLMLQTHYRSPLDFSDERLHEAQTALDRLRNANAVIAELSEREGTADTAAELAVQAETFLRDFDAAMDDDFNTALAISQMFGLAKEINRYHQEIERGVAFDAANFKKAADDYHAMAAIIGIFEQEETQADDGLADALMELIIGIRQEARAAKNWAVADRIRDGLKEAGVIIEDTPTGVRWKRA